jgi:mRNA interferase RelE/StbE
MIYDLQFMPPARRDLKGLPKPVQERIAIALRELMDNPRPPGVKKLVGDPNTWRIRIGQYRVVYEIHDRRLLVLVVRVGHRKDIYRR